jgi:hypothetical protein
MTEQDALEEYYSKAENERRRNIPGRRKIDFQACSIHAIHCAQDKKDKEIICGQIKETKKEIEKHKEEVKQDVEILHGRIGHLSEKIVGRWMFGILVTILLTIFMAFGSINLYQNTEIRKELKDQAKQINQVEALLITNNNKGSVQ